MAFNKASGAKWRLRRGGRAVASGAVSTGTRRRGIDVAGSSRLFLAASLASRCCCPTRRHHAATRAEDGPPINNAVSGLLRARKQIECRIAFGRHALCMASLRRAVYPLTVPPSNKVRTGTPPLCSSKSIPRKVTMDTERPTAVFNGPTSTGASNLKDRRVEYCKNQRHQNWGHS